jgi:superfamily I DNA and/or RNA helicase
LDFKLFLVFVFGVSSTFLVLRSIVAPTNKAISVVCNRFLNTFIDEQSFPCNVVLIGDDEKLFDDNFHRRRMGDGSFSKLRSIFLYTYLDIIYDEYLYISKSLSGKASLSLATKYKIQKIALRLSNRISQNITDKYVRSLSVKISRLVDEFCDVHRYNVPSELEDTLRLIRTEMNKWDRENIWQEIIKNADVIFGTLASTGGTFLRKSIGQIEDLIVDEAAAVTEPEMYIPFFYSPKRLLAVGDPKQLPATISSQAAEKLGLDKSLHERLMYDCHFDHVLLDTQYRSKPCIMQFPATQFYDKKLMNGGNVIRPGYTSGLTMMGAPPYAMFQVNGREKQSDSGSYQNVEEAMAVVEIIDKFRPLALKKFGENWCSSDRLRVITFYQAQVSLISQMLRRKGLGSVLVATVDSSQGCEADHVIVSFVRSYGDAGRSSVGFLADERRLNVGLTRAKYQLICVGNVTRMSTLPEGKADIVRSLALDAISRNCLLPFDPSQVKPNSRLASQMRGTDDGRPKRKRASRCRSSQPRSNGYYFKSQN